MADEGLIIDVDYNITKAEAKTNKLNRAFELAKQKAANIKKEIQALNDEIERSKIKEQEYTAEAERLRQRAHEYIKGDLDLSDEQVKIERKRREELEKLIDKEQAFQREKEKSIDRQNLNLKKQTNETKNIGDQLAVNSKTQTKSTKAFEKSSKSLSRISKRIGSLIASALFFSLITKAFTALRNEFGKLLTESGTKTASLVSQLKGNLATIGRTLYETAKPAIEWILQALVKMTALLTSGLAKILGKNVNEMRKLAEETSNAGKEAKKATAGFDTLQTIDTSNGEEESKIDTSALTTPIKIDPAFNDIVENFEDIGENITRIFQNITQKVKNILKNSGPELSKTWEELFSPMINWALEDFNEVITIFGDAVDEILDMFSNEDFKVIIDAFTYIWSFVKGGLSEAKTILKATLDFIIDTVKGVIQVISGIFEYIGGVIEVFVGAIEIAVGFFTDDTELMTKGTERMQAGVKKAINGVIKIFVGLVNTLRAVVNFVWEHIVAAFRGLVNSIGGLVSKIGNKLGFNWGDWEWKFKTPTIPEWNPPKLATGAVLPGGSPMLAWVNDQPKGQPYIEGSIENIAAAFEKYLNGKGLGNQNITIEAKGNWAQFIKWMNLQIKQENKRASIF